MGFGIIVFRVDRIAEFDPSLKDFDENEGDEEAEKELSFERRGWCVSRQMDRGGSIILEIICVVNEG